MIRKAMIILLIALLIASTTSSETKAQQAAQSDTHIINTTIFTGGGDNVTSDTAFGNVHLGEAFTGFSSSQNSRFGFLHTTNKTLSPVTVAATMNITLNNEDFNGTFRTTFSINASAVCIGNGCSQVTTIPYFGLLTEAIGTQLNSTPGGAPFFNVSEVVDQTCSANLLDNAECSVNWTVNATRGGNYAWTINFTSSSGDVLQNGTLPFFTNITGCVETWEATGWVQNGTFEYRSVKDTSFCGTNDNIPVTRRLLSEWFIAAIIIIAGSMMFLYRGSIELDDKHWQFKMGLFYAALGVGWAGMNVIVRIATETDLTDGMRTAISNVYYAYSIIGILAVIYLGIRFFAFTFHKLLAVARRKETEESEQAW